MTEFRKLALVRADGRFYAGIYVETGKSAADTGQNPRGMREVEVDDWPERWQRYDGATWGSNAKDKAAAIDDAHAANHGPLAITIAHGIKAIEAQIICQGFDLPQGMVAAEAAATGEDRAALAARIIANAQENYAAEVARRVAKRT